LTVNNTRIKVGVIGASGYTGLELLKILIYHPTFTLTYIANSEGGISVDELHPSLKTIIALDVKKANVDECASSCDLVFLALPHKTSMAFVKPLMAKGIKIVDLSADYRLTQDVYEKYYCPHTDIENLNNVVYGLPELYRKEIKKTSLVANPGCFPTSAILGLLPFMDVRIKNTPIIIDAKTGVSGAGKKRVTSLSFFPAPLTPVFASIIMGVFFTLTSINGKSPSIADVGKHPGFATKDVFLISSLYNSGKP
jgi:N-acetyl-gamma-glutamyl-phosphate reductase